jgi:hypothetical protein
MKVAVEVFNDVCARVQASTAMLNAEDDGDAQGECRPLLSVEWFVVWGGWLLRTRVWSRVRHLTARYGVFT